MLRFKLWGMKVTIDFLFVALVTFFLLTDQSGLAVISLIACFSHELGHILMFFCVGYIPRALSFEFTGIRLTKPQQELRPFRDFLVQIAGSSVNFIVAGILFLYGGGTYLYLIALTNLLLGIFQLLPLSVLDGGKILELILSSFCSERVVHKITFAANVATILFLCIFCVFLWATANKSLTLLVFSGGLMMVAGTKLLQSRKARRKKQQKN